MRGAVRCGVRVHIHVADRVPDLLGHQGPGRGVVVVMMVVVVVAVMVMAVGRLTLAHAPLLVSWSGGPALGGGPSLRCLTYIPSWGMVSSMNATTRKAVASRLRRIEGQVGGLLRMVEEDRYCLDILTQINAVRAALHKVEGEILKDHVAHCVAHAFAGGDPVEQRHKVDELVETIGRMTR